MLEKQQLVDSADANMVYYGESDPGRITSSRYWHIYAKKTVGTLVSYLLPIGSRGLPSNKEEFSWDERAALAYSTAPDTTAPTLSTVTIASNNSTTTLAKPGDVVTITVVASEYIKNIVATIAGRSATVVEGIDDKHFTLTQTMLAGDANGVVPFTIDFTDIGGRAGTQVVALTGGSDVTYDKTAPVATLMYSVDAGSNYATTITTKNADTLRIKATFSEALLDAPVVKIAIDNAILVATAMTKSSTTEYYYDLNVPAGNIPVATCSLSVGTDASGNVVTAAPVNATFEVDNTLIAMESAERISNTTLRVTFSEDALDATLNQANDGGFIVFETGTPATTYAVTATAKNGSNSNQIDLTVDTVLASAAVGLTITYVAAGNGIISDTTGNLMATDATGVLIDAWA